MIEEKSEEFLRNLLDGFAKERDTAARNLNVVIYSISSAGFFICINIILKLINHDPEKNLIVIKTSLLLFLLALLLQIVSTVLDVQGKSKVYKNNLKVLAQYFGINYTELNEKQKLKKQEEFLQEILDKGLWEREKIQFLEDLQISAFSTEVKIAKKLSKWVSPILILIASSLLVCYVIFSI